MQHLPDLICRTDRRGRLVYTNPQSTWPYEPASASPSAKTLRSALPPGAGRDRLIAALKTVRDTARPVVLELPCGSLGRGTRCRYALLPEFGRNGRVATVAIVASKITGREQASADARAARKAQQVFLSDIGHDLRTPLAGIMNLVGLMGDDPQTNCTRENIDLIQEAGQQLKTMIDTLLDKLRGESIPREPAERLRSSQHMDNAAPLVDALTSFSGPLRVLVVEDNYINLLAFRQTLEQSGFSVTEAKNGQEALDCLQREPFDLVLMDVRMPIMDGLEATRRIRASKDQRLRETKVIALTGYSMPVDRRRILAAGADGIISKPIDATELTQALHDIYPSGSAHNPV